MDFIAGSLLEYRCLCLVPMEIKLWEGEIGVERWLRMCESFLASAHELCILS